MPEEKIQIAERHEPINPIRAIGAITYNIGLAVGDPSVVTVLSGASALVTIILSIILLKEKINATQVVGILLTILGVMVLSIV